MEIPDQAVKRPLRKSVSNTLGTNKDGATKPGSFSLWVATRFSPMLQKFRASGNKENALPAGRERSPKEWGSLIYRYVKNQGMNNTVFTLYELIKGTDTVDQEFHGLEKEILIESLKTLERKRKAEIFAGDEGVKFF